MPTPFRRLTPSEFDAQVRNFNWMRRIWRIDLHHSVDLPHADYQGLATIERMQRANVVDGGFDDIAQHVSVAPDGVIWTGRNWNTDPASVGYGMNAGVFMVKAIGNFDFGHDRLDGRQLEVVVHVINSVQQNFRLPVQTLLFHREVPQTAKTCPGSSVEKPEILRLVARQRRQRGPMGGPVDRGQTAMVA